jgi:hypothetical protein
MGRRWEESRVSVTVLVCFRMNHCGRLWERYRSRWPDEELEQMYHSRSGGTSHSVDGYRRDDAGCLNTESAKTAHTRAFEGYTKALTYVRPVSAYRDSEATHDVRPCDD